MESLGSVGFGGLVKEILDWVFSPSGSVALIVIAVTLVLRAFRPRRRGTKPARNTAWLKKRLAGKGFKKWVYLDLLLYLVLAKTFGLGSFYALGTMADAFTPTGYDFLFRPERGWLMLPALFLGLALPGFLWFPFKRMIHGMRFRKYVLYMIAHQNADTRAFIKWGCTPIVILCVVGSIQMSRAHTGLSREGAAAMIVQQKVFALQPERYVIGNANAVYFVARRRAPNGNIVKRPYVTVTFAEGRVWTSAWWVGEPEGERLIELTRRISSRAGLPVIPRTFLDDADTTKISGVRRNHSQ